MIYKMFSNFMIKDNLNYKKLIINIINIFYINNINGKNSTIKRTN